MEALLVRTISNGPKSNLEGRLVRGGRSLNKGLSDHDVRHNFSFNYVYQLPSFGLSVAAAKHVLEGWQINGSFTRLFG